MKLNAVVYVGVFCVLGSFSGIASAQEANTSREEVVTSRMELEQLFEGGIENSKLREVPLSEMQETKAGPRCMTMVLGGNNYVVPTPCL